MPKKASRKVTAADLFAAPEQQQPPPPPQQPQPAPPGGQPQQQLRIPSQGVFKVTVQPTMAPPGVMQQTMLPISAVSGGPPVAMVPAGFVLPQGAQPGMTIDVPWKLVGPPQPVPPGMGGPQPQPGQLPPLQQMGGQPQQRQPVPSPAPQPEPEPPLAPPSDITAVLADGVVRIAWTPPKLPGQRLNDGSIMPETNAPW